MKSAPINKLVRAIEEVLPERRPIEHHEPDINADDQHFAAASVYSISNPMWQRGIEDRLRKICGVEQAVAVSSGTAALHLILISLGIKAGEEVLVPALTFVATANAVRYVGAIPNFVDGVICVNAYKLRRYLEVETSPTPDRRGRRNQKTGRVISALIAVDLCGFPADFTKLAELASEYGLLLIEDASQALGSTLKDRACGSYGVAAAISFNNNKIVTGNGGGAVLTNCEWIASKVHQLANTARKPHPWLIEHDEVGYNYRMSSLSAALICSQLDRLPTTLKAKLELLHKYIKAVSPFDGYEVVTAKEWHGSPNYWLIMLKVPDEALRDLLLAKLHQNGIRARAMFTPLNRLFTESPSHDLGYADYTFKTTICLPSGVGLCGV